MAAAPPRWYVARDARRVEIAREHSFAGRGLLHFGDDGGRAGAQSGAEIAASGAPRLGLALPLILWCAALRKFLAFSGDNTGKDIWNGVSQG